MQPLTWQMCSFPFRLENKVRNSLYSCGTDNNIYNSAQDYVKPPAFCHNTVLRDLDHLGIWTPPPCCLITPKTPCWVGKTRNKWLVLSRPWLDAHPREGKINLPRFRDWTLQYNLEGPSIRRVPWYSFPSKRQIAASCIFHHKHSAW